MQIKIENNIVLVAQKNQEDLTGYQEVSPIEAQIIYQANETDSLSMINGAYYEPKNNADWQAEKAERERVFKNTGLQNQINELELKRVRAFVEPGIKNKETGETYLEAVTKDIQELRKQMT